MKKAMKKACQTFEILTSVAGMIIIGTRKKHNNSRKTIYNVLLSCGHIVQLSGNAIASRRYRHNKKSISNLCDKCAKHAVAKKRKEIELNKAINRPIITDNDAFLLMNTQLNAGSNQKK